MKEPALGTVICTFSPLNFKWVLSVLVCVILWSSAGRIKKDCCMQGSWGIVFYLTKIVSEPNQNIYIIIPTLHALLFSLKSHQNQVEILYLQEIKEFKIFFFQSYYCDAIKALMHFCDKLSHIFYIIQMWVKLIEWKTWSFIPRIKPLTKSQKFPSLFWSTIALKLFWKTKLNEGTKVIQIKVIQALKIYNAKLNTLLGVTGVRGKQNMEWNMPTTK